MGIRIDPTLEFVWRDPSTVQLGVDPPRAVVPVPTTAEERFLCALRRETNRDALAALARTTGCRPEVAARLLGTASPAVVDVLPEPLARVEVHGAGALADHVADLLSGEGVTVARTSAPRGGPVPLPDPDPAIALVVADHVVDPAVRSAWTRRGTPHLALVVGDGRIRLGPVVVPGDGPCLQCVEYARVDADPAWPAVAAQVWGRPAAALSPWRSAAVAAAATRVVVRRLPHRTQRPDTDQVVFDRDDLAVTVVPVTPHPRCACRALPGTDSGPGLPHAWNPVATT
ncbi:MULTISPECIES: TOMM precursor leader peptide-binding protein [unclassified Curtobacterium]|uniref:TOMM precursor leader peptide-binding protein n=1 Tax=unclassified Curtobacterium TaxID=257496 RepID=UPI000826F3FC|nr:MULTISPECIES: TOMM precursor leader peptide-binding protein [unclassified Curtobacterium]WIA97749.1 TOMM precursor leader peptide-binding protein [Curtobacterium sp. MCBA15_004]WIB01023.1 TOMM precursor leader peptide-binding protein [Curtobacterium sp. MCBA15_012]